MNGGMTGNPKFPVKVDFSAAFPTQRFKYLFSFVNFFIALGGSVFVETLNGYLYTHN